MFSAVFYPRTWILSPTSREDYGFPGPSKVRFSGFKVVVQEKSAKIEPWILCSKSGFSKGKMRNWKYFHGQSIYEKHVLGIKNSISPLFGVGWGLFWTVKKIFFDQKFFIAKSSMKIMVKISQNPIFKGNNTQHTFGLVFSVDYDLKLLITCLGTILEPFGHLHMAHNPKMTGLAVLSQFWK